MTTYANLLADYKTRMRTVVYMMVANLVWLVLFLPVFPVPEEASESLGAGGGFMCLGLWILAMIFFAAFLVRMVLRSHEVYAVLGCMVSWAFFVALVSFGYPIWVYALNILVPGGLTIAVVRMMRVMRRTRWGHPPRPPTEYPVAGRP